MECRLKLKQKKESTYATFKRKCDGSEAEQWNKLEFLFIAELSHLGKRKYACKHMEKENKDHQNTFT